MEQVDYLISGNSSTFGNAANKTFGTTSAFGSQTPNTGGTGLFGQQQSTTQATGLFGQQQNTGGAFGGAQSSAFSRHIFKDFKIA